MKCGIVNLRSSMIKISRSQKFWSDLEKLHFSSLNASPYFIKDELQKLIDAAQNNKDVLEYNLFEHLKLKLPDILIGTPNVLESVILSTEPFILKIKKEIETNFPEDKRADEIAKLNKKITDTFSYSTFTGKYSGYGAYALVRKLNVNTCPYCNRQYTVTITTKEGRTRAKLDHWFDKATHPYLSVSLYNLIPCCTVCNSDLKNTEKFNLSTNIHPYVEGFENIFLFKTNITRADYMAGGVDSFNLSLELESSVDKKNTIIPRAEENMRVFCIKDLYNCHKEVAGKLIEKIDSNSDDYIEELLEYKNSTGVPLFKSKEDIINRYFDIITDVNKFENEVFSKLKRDIGIEQKLFTL